MAYFTNEMTKNKLMLLYFLSSMNTTLSKAQLTVAMTELCMSYYETQPVIAELEEKGFVATLPCAFGQGYKQTEKAEELLSVSKEQLPASARRECDEYIQQNYERIMQLERFSSYSIQRADGYDAILSSFDNNKFLMSLSIHVPDSETARKICDNWESRSSLVYQIMLDVLERDDTSGK